MGYTKEEKAMIWLDSFPLDYAGKAALLRAAKDPYALVERPNDFIRPEEKRDKKVFADMLASLESAEYMKNLLSSYESKGIHCVTCFSSLYPEALRNIDDPPFVLYCKGNLSLLGERKFSVVGSRKTLPQALASAEDFSRGLSRYFVIVTGLAEGGDSAAIAGALASGRLISVLAFGFDHVYPACNRGLLDKIMEKGLAVTEYIPSQKAEKYLFPKRNRIIAGLSEGVLVVSGGLKSGTRITARYAYEFGRDVFAFPYSIGAQSGEGCNRLIKEYAKLADNLVDITSAFGINLTEKGETELSEEEKITLAAIGETETHISAISRKTGFPPYRAQTYLTMLQMKKLIVSCGGNRYAVVRKG